jgi:hypothetical protein
VQVPAWHVSVFVQALLSLHDAPLAFAGLEHRPVAMLQVPASWHWSGAAHVTGLAPVQVPAWHVSVCVQALLSLHDAPLAFAGLEHRPVAVLQVPASWHWSGTAHATGLLPAHTPAWHMSICVQALLSLHVVPLALLGNEQTPLTGLQEPAVWHWSGAAHVTGFAPVHVPAWQVSAWVQALLSLHAVPFATGGATHAPVPVLHAAMEEPHARRLDPLICTGVSLLVLPPN